MSGNAAPHELFFKYFDDSISFRIASDMGWVFENDTPSESSLASGPFTSQDDEAAMRKV